MRSSRLWRLLAVATLAVAILAAVAVLAPGTRRAPDPGIATTTTTPPGATEAAPVLPDACTLVTAADATAALGKPVVAVLEADESCSYATDEESPATVRVDVRAAPEGVSGLRQQREDAIRTFGVGAVADVEGLGEAAFLTDPQTGLALLQVVSARVSLIIGVAGPVPDPAAAARALAEVAVSRM